MFIAIAIIVLLAALLAFAATRPNSFRVERSLSIQAPPERLCALIQDFHAWRGWSPWENLDADLQRTYSGSAGGKGAIYVWEGKKSGKGRMEVMDVAPHWRVLIKLDFIKPFEAHNTTEFTLEGSADATKVVWAMYGPSSFISKLMGVFVSMDTMIGKDFEKGLANMKAAAE